jgi:pimeloyl-ACP methyl ester carboxylesterase
LLGLVASLSLTHPQLSMAQTVGQTGAPASGMATIAWYDTGIGRLKAKEYPSAHMGAQPVLIVVLHGDAPFSPPTYQYRFAAQAAALTDNAVVAAILRPGYSDKEDQSDGTKGMTTGDNYTPEVIDAVAKVIEAMKSKYGAGRVVIVGHSGGAAISADLLGRHPSLVSAALLVSCPCDLPKWRAHMKSVQGTSIWDVPITGLSPLDLVADVSPSVQVSMVAGAEDHVAPPELTNEYATALRAHGVPVEVTVAPGLPHDILLEPAVFDTLRRLLQAS